MKLELKHLVPYLPYGLKAEFKNNGGRFKHDTIRSLHINWVNLLHDFDTVKPILRPLSDLTKYCDDLGFIPIEELSELYISLYSTPPNRHKEEIKLFIKQKTWLINNGQLLKMSYWINDKLFKWHFDVFGLIENNLAIDINTLNE